LTSSSAWYGRLVDSLGPRLFCSFSSKNRLKRMNSSKVAKDEVKFGGGSTNVVCLPGGGWFVSDPVG